MSEPEYIDSDDGDEPVLRPKDGEHLPYTEDWIPRLPSPVPLARPLRLWSSSCDDDALAAAAPAAPAAMTGSATAADTGATGGAAGVPVYRGRFKIVEYNKLSADTTAAATGATGGAAGVPVYRGRFKIVEYNKLSADN
jgi:hypothetical protein